MLGLLDAFKDLKNIPDPDMEAAITLLLNQLEAYNDTELDKLTGYALKYPPRARALPGALLSSLKKGRPGITELKNSLNPLTIFKIGINTSLLQTVPEWHIQ